MTFAVITPALITGAIADRMRFGRVGVVHRLWSMLVYLPVAHWVFAGGWLAERGALDFAGGTVVHVNAGAGALALVLLLGRRTGWPGEPMPPHSLPLTLLGTGILWFGWFGFNAGSALGGQRRRRAGVPQHVRRGRGGDARLARRRARRGAGTRRRSVRRRARSPGWSRSRRAPGSSAGWRRSSSGSSPGVVCFLAIQLKFRFGYDDSLDVIAVHLVGGIIGSVLLGLFADAAVNPAGHGRRVLRRRLGLVRRAGARGRRRRSSFSFVVSVRDRPRAEGGAARRHPRATEDEEDEGLDLTQHSETGYALERGLDGERHDETGGGDRQAVQARRREGRAAGARGAGA